MSKVDWENAPADAEACLYGVFVKWSSTSEFEFIEGGWVEVNKDWTLDSYGDEFRRSRIEMRPDEWKKGAKRMEQIAQNGNGGEVYDELENNKSKYHREIKKGVFVDVYDVLSAFEVVNPAMQHALKKMLAPGKRGAKDTIQDMKEAIQSIERAIELEKEKGE